MKKQIIFQPRILLRQKSHVRSQAQNQRNVTNVKQIKIINEKNEELPDEIRGTVLEGLSYVQLRTVIYSTDMHSVQSAAA